MSPPTVLLIAAETTAGEQLRAALEQAAIDATVETTEPECVDTTLLRTAVDCLVVPVTCGGMAGGHLAAAATGLYPNLPVIMYGSEADRGDHIRTVDGDLGSPELAAAVGAALEDSETMAARPASRPETILATMFERYSEHLYVKDDDRHYLLLNDSSYAPPELLGRRDEDGLPAGATYLDAARGDDLQVINDGADVLDVHEFSPSMGKHLQTSKIPWYDETDELIGLIGITQDITDQKERERLLRQQNERLRKVALLAAHELRNELQVSTGHLSQVEADDEHIDAVERSIDQLSGIVDKVVSLASSDSPAFEPEQQWLSTVVWDVWSSLSLEAASLEVTSDRRLLADAESMRLFLEILLSNAVEHGGPDVAIRVGATSSGFFVADDGPGVDVSPPERVLEAGYASEKQNSGFGLYIANRIAKEHGWSLSVDDSEAGGARFTVTDVERPD
ncbi:ATP-binding protein [Haloarcula sp. KBTZ06]|nr:MULTISPECIES: PAS domain-containing sensor histidine kinase [Haloarcula]AJF27451.1 signal transduction protein [Haloarcula sp. CBA1115]KAA9408224.1 PAS domain-containing sensor histidine kinase [Haloarcula sp. CBA1131]KAA9409371.1 PAS domain-containing sensor histidine kinase [Haloarcula hispanica]KZX47894.1 signal transduction protein [Haloarcula sp. K1]MCJ0618420.1 PAS domain-containing protein [Haloarcula hispanica]